MKDKKGFGSRIKNGRENQALTIEFAAELCEVSSSSWQQYERGERLPSISNFIKICIILEVTPAYLLGPELDGLQGNLNEVEQLKLKIDQLNMEEIAIVHAAVSKCLELIYL